MKNLIILGITLLIVTPMLLMTGCSAIFHTTELGNIVEKNYAFQDFTDVEISNAFQYDIKQSDTYSVVVSVHENQIDRLDIHQSGNTLFVGMKFVPFSTPDTRIAVTLPQLNKLIVNGDCEGNATGFTSNSDLAINLSGASRLAADFQAGTTKLDVSGDSRITGDLTSADTQIILSGASRFDMTLKTGKTEIDASGDSEVRGSLHALDCGITLSGASICELIGSAGNGVIVASGDSNLNSPDLTLQSADVKLTGASEASFYTNGMLNIDINGDSTLNYYGNPSIGKTNISGASKLNHK